MSDKDQCCGTCRHYSSDGEDWICTNYSSDACGEYTAYNDTCDEWEERET